MNRTLLFCGIISLFTACSQHTPQVPITRIQSEKIEKQVILLNPVDMAINGTRLWISDYSAEDLVWVLDATTGSLEAKFLKQGNGPGESRPPMEILFDKDRIWFYSRSILATLFQGEQQTVLEQGNKALKSIFRFSPETEHILPLSDTTFLTSGIFEKSRFQWINIHYPDSIVALGTFPDYWTEEKNIPIAAKNRFHHTLLFLNKHCNRIAAISPYILSFYEINNTGITPLKDTLLADYQYDYQNSGMIRTSKKRPGIMLGCQDATANDRHIYLLFDTNTSSDPTTNPTNYPLLHIYDWNGLHIRTLDPGIRMSTITVDANDQYLYALTDLGNEEGPEIVRISL